MFLTSLIELLTEVQAHDLVTSPAPLLQLHIDWCVELFGGMHFRREEGIVRALTLLGILQTRVHSLLVSITSLMESWNESGQQERRATRTASVSEKDSFDESDEQMRRKTYLWHKVFEVIGVMNKVVLTEAQWSLCAMRCEMW